MNTLHIILTTYAASDGLSSPEGVQAFVNFFLLIGMFVALMLPILAIPYIFIKMGHVAGQAFSKMQDFSKKRGRSAFDNSSAGQALKQRRAMRQHVRAERGRKLLGRAGPVVGGGVRRDSRQAYRDLQEAETKKGVDLAKKRLIRSGTIGDGQLRDLALDRGADEHERRAAMELLAERGRVNPLRQVGDALPQTGHEREWFEDAVTANSGRVYGKAPDLNSGNPAPFSGNSAADVAGFHASTINRAVTHGTAAEHAELIDAYDEAMRTPQLAGQIDATTRTAWENLRTQAGLPHPPPAAGGPAPTPPPTPPPAGGPGGGTSGGPATPPPIRVTGGTTGAGPGGATVSLPPQQILDQVDAAGGWGKLSDQDLQTIHSHVSRMPIASRSSEEVQLYDLAEKHLTGRDYLQTPGGGWTKDPRA